MDTRLVANTPFSVLGRAVFKRLGVALFFLAAFYPGRVHAQELIYSEVRTDQPVISAGTELSLEVVLLDGRSATPSRSIAPFLEYANLGV